MNVSPRRQGTSNATTMPLLTQTRSRLPSRSLSPYPYRSRSKDRASHTNTNTNMTSPHGPAQVMPVSHVHKFKDHDQPGMLTRHQLASAVLEQDRRGRSRSREKRRGSVASSSSSSGLSSSGSSSKSISLMGFDVSTNR
ncbi:hypothetical protein Cantr_05518 [Candida viswanathii]|uniref:Uncharacterized protein n=1 Tax=Candida viswanathii TaxID=5486 RepID=A0A367XS19_9ASCO|nr:hypothetical protein Cantr_05518 [Candida viswanathii]